MCKQEEPEKLSLPKLPTLGEIRACIPPECFERNWVHSLWLVLRDGLLLAANHCIALSCLHLPGGSDGPLSTLDWAGWAFFAFAQGTVLTGWWVLAHECAHGSLFYSKTANDAVGWVLWSVCLVPYFSAQYTHCNGHHGKTNHLMEGEMHVPDLFEEMQMTGLDKLFDLIGEDSFALLQIFLKTVFGLPAYLFFNVTGGRRLKDGSIVRRPFSMDADHFRPNSKHFPPSWKNRVALSTFGIALVIAGCVWAAQIYGFAAVFVCYLAPYMFVNFWMILYTWMTHTDPDIPHYGDDVWTWLRGALCTIDRPYTFFDWFHHHLGSTHVCHHVFPKMPCYHAQEGTKHLKAFLEPKGLYNYDATPWPLAAFRLAKTCHYVEGTDGVQYFKSLSDRSAKKES